MFLSFVLIKKNLVLSSSVPPERAAIVADDDLGLGVIPNKQRRRACTLPKTECVAVVALLAG